MGQKKKKKPSRKDVAGHRHAGSSDLFAGGSQLALSCFKSSHDRIQVLAERRRRRGRWVGFVERVDGAAEEEEGE